MRDGVYGRAPAVSLMALAKVGDQVGEIRAVERAGAVNIGRGGGARSSRRVAISHFLQSMFCIKLDFSRRRNYATPPERHAASSATGPRRYHYVSRRVSCPSLESPAIRVRRT